MPSIRSRNAVVLTRNSYGPCVASIPTEYRAALRAALDDLAAGNRPELLTWVRAYGASGAVLIRQPDDVWEHPRSDFGQRDDGAVWVTLPLWTTDEGPSDLSAECEVRASGAAVVNDVHVL